MRLFIKDPDSTLDYKMDWSTWLDGDTIATSAWSVSSLTEESSTNTTSVAVVWLSGGTVGEKHIITNRITTAAGRTVDRSMAIRIVER